MKLGLTVAALLFATACPPPVSTSVPTTAIPVVDTTLGVGDVFEVRVYGEPDLSNTFKIGQEGTISFPLAGTIKVEGLEPQQIAKRISERLADGILRNPQVTVLVKEQVSKKVFIIGQVSKPGTLPYSPSMSVVEAITQAGGFTPLAAKNDTTLTRNEAGAKKTIRVPVEDIGRGRAENVYLRPGDIISVPERLF
jgi:polysaccharide export outer membrane protein